MAKKSNGKLSPEAILETYSKIKDIKASIKELEEEAKVLQATITASIPEGEKVNGVSWKNVERKSTTWTAAIEAIKEKLVPKTKQAQVAQVIELFTKTTSSPQVYGPRGAKEE